MKTCTQCGTELPDQARFCLNCGAAHGASATATPVEAQVAGSANRIAQAGGVIAEDESMAIGGSVAGHVIVAESGATVVVGEAPVPMTAVQRESAMGRYLQHIISRNRYLQLQGIRSGGRLVHIELDQIYITLRATRQRVVQAEERFLAEMAGRAPGERWAREEATETVTVSVNEALAAHGRLAVLGDPGSGKTTLLRYLALLYAQDMAEGTQRATEKLGLAESGFLPILLPLRGLGAFLKAYQATEDGTEGHATLLDFALRCLSSERIDVPRDFFDQWLTAGRAVILLDGLDEVADPELRRRVSRLVERFTCAYPACRYLVTSRIVGYAGAARLGEEYATTTVRDFTLADIQTFLTNWHRMVAIGQQGAGESADSYAQDQTEQLLSAIQGNERIRELAINPLMLTVIAMVHRDRVKLPDRRAELYAEAVDVLLGKWDEARGVQEAPILEGQSFDTGDRRLMLQAVALHMHEQQQKEIEIGPLCELLRGLFGRILSDARQAGAAVERFLHVMEERTGLLVARGQGVYAFSHLTFQEYLAALAMAARDDYVTYTLSRAPQAWWREAILLEAGHLSTQSADRTTHLIEAIAGFQQEPEPYHNLVLAAECLRDVGSGRVPGNLGEEIRLRLRAELETPAPRGRFASVRTLLRRGMTARELAERRVAAAGALARIGGQRFWIMPYGEPEWVEVPAGAFWMGGEMFDDERPRHQTHLDGFRIARVPITNAQYLLFTQATGQEAPSHWQDGRPPRGDESHPVVNVSWHDALAYCRWLSQVTGKAITLPSEAEWEKAARGEDGREYPWGDGFEATRCNSAELGLGGTTPVGIFSEGASPYGCLDMAGNAWEWTRSLWGKDWQKPEYGYSYNPKDGREDLEAGDDVARVVRGGSFYFNERHVRCACRHRGGPSYRHNDLGFRVVVAPV